jgi:hypothetical protein
MEKGIVGQYETEIVHLNTLNKITGDMQTALMKMW